MNRPDPTRYFLDVDGGLRKQYCLPVTISQRRRIIGDYLDIDGVQRRDEELNAWGRDNNITFQFDLLSDVRDRYTSEYDRIMMANDVSDQDRERILRELQDREEYLFNAFFFDNRTHAFLFKLRWF